MPYYETSVARFVSGVLVKAGGVFYSATTLNDPTLTLSSAPVPAPLTTSTLPSGLQIESYADGTTAVLPPAVGSLASGTALDTGTLGGVSLPQAVLVLQGTSQAVAGVVVHTGSLAAAAGLFVSPLEEVYWSGGYNQGQNNPQPSSINSNIQIGGTINESGIQGSYYHELCIYDRVAAGVTSSLGGLAITHDALGGFVTGGRQAVTINFNLQGPTSNTTGGEYSALNVFAGSSGPDNGVAGASSASTLFCMNPQLQMINPPFAISSIAYTSGTGVTVLTLSGPAGFSAGGSFTLAGITGIAGLNGTWTATAVSGNTVTFTATTGLSGTPAGGTFVTPAYYGGGVASEWDITVGANVFVRALYGLNIALGGSHVNPGTIDDIGLMYSGVEGAACWKVGIGFGANLKPAAFNATSTFIKAFPDVVTGTLVVGNGIDFYNGGAVAIEGNAWISNGCTVTGTGTVTAKTVIASTGAISSGTSDLTLDFAGEANFVGNGTALRVSNQSTFDVNFLSIQGGGTGQAVQLFVSGEGTGGFQVSSGEGPMYLNAFTGQDVLVGARNPGTAETAGFACIPCMAGLPTGTPTDGSVGVGWVAPLLAVNNNGTYYLSAYINGGWRKVAVS